MSTSRRAAIGWLVFALIAIAFVWVTWPLRIPGSENSRLLVVFYVDEATHFNQVASAAAAHTYQVAWEMGYGYAFFNLVQSVLLIRPPVSEQQIILTLRTVEWSFALATLVVVFVAVRRVSIAAALLTTALLATLPVFARWSVISHPDMMQLLFIWVSLYACARRLERGGRRWTMVAAAAAGIAFAAKFAGMFLFPLIWGTDLLARSQPPYSGRALRATRIVIIAAAIAGIGAALVLSPAFVAAHLTRDGSIEFARSSQLIQEGRVALLATGLTGLVVAAINAIWRRLMASPISGMPSLVVSTLVAFFAAFTVTSAQAWRGLHFVRMLILNASFPAIDVEGPPSWLALLGSHDMFTAGVLVFAILGVVWVLMRLRDFRGRSAFEVVQLAWLVVFGAAIAVSLRGHDRSPYYLLPIVPTILLLAARGWEGLLALVRRRPAAAAAAGVAVLASMAIAELAYDATRLVALRREVLHQEDDSRPVQFGRTLSCYLRPQAKILFDYLSYVPPEFADAQPTWGGTLTLLDQQHPDAIIVNTTIEAFYRAPGAGPDDPYRYYAGLRDNGLGFRLVATDTPVRLYLRTDSPNVVSARGCS